MDRNKLIKAQIAEGQKELFALVKEARRNVESLIIEATSQKNFVKAATLRDGLYKGIVDEYVSLNRGVDDWTKERGYTVSKAWHTLAIDDLPKGVEGATFGQFSKKYLDDLIGRINPSTIDKRVGINAQVSGMMNEDLRAIRIAVSDTIRKGALTGMTNPELSAEMQKRANQIKAGATFTDKAGKKWSSDSYFGMLNRTLHTTVARETYNDMMADAGLDLVQVVGKSNYPDSPCIQYEGEILSLTGATKGHTTVAEATGNGLFHPNCIHTTIVYTPEGKK
jgi:hypothetical protein